MNEEEDNPIEYLKKMRLKAASLLDDMTNSNQFVLEAKEKNNQTPDNCLNEVQVTDIKNDSSPPENILDEADWWRRFDLFSS